VLKRKGGFRINVQLEHLKKNRRKSPQGMDAHYIEKEEIFLANGGKGKPTAR